MDMENNNVTETTVHETVIERAEGEILGVDPEAQNNKGKVMGIISLVIGIVSILLLCASYCFGTMMPFSSIIVVLPLIASIVGIILGILGVKNSTESKGLAIAGLIVSIVALVISIPLVGCAACTTCACLGGVASSMSAY